MPSADSLATPNRPLNSAQSAGIGKCGKMLSVVHECCFSCNDERDESFFFKRRPERDPAGEYRCDRFNFSRQFVQFVC